ncbi:hypothetical protein ACO1MN_15635, partial [Staphylococcus aureus]
ALAAHMSVTHGYHAMGLILQGSVDHLYDLASFDIYKNILTIFPYDFLLRLISSILQLFKMRPAITIFHYNTYLPYINLPTSIIAF